MKGDRIPGARVETLRHYPECGDLCVECVMWRHIDKLRASYEAKVEALAAETLRTSALTAKLAAAEAERDRWKDDADHFAVQSIGQMQRADRFLAEKDEAEAKLAKATAVVQAAQRLDLAWRHPNWNPAPLISALRDELANYHAGPA